MKISYIGENKMWGVDEIKSYLKDNLKPSRYGHTLGVVKTAIELRIHNEDKQKAGDSSTLSWYSKKYELWRYVKGNRRRKSQTI